MVWPRCFVCQDAVGAYEIADVGSKRIDIVARCRHGREAGEPDEECLRITWDTDSVAWEDVGDRIKSLVFFRPDNYLDVGGAAVIGAGSK